MTTEEPRETDAALVARHGRVADLLDQARQSMHRCTRPSSRLRKAQWAGSLNFLLLGIERELTDRGLFFRPRSH